MKIVSLLENTTSSKSQTSVKLKSKHGLCFYIELNDHKILFDLGPDDTYIKNAQRLEIDLKDIDVVIISHGHSDHGGGLESFLNINTKAIIYYHQHAFEEHYYAFMKVIKMKVGLNQSLQTHPRLKEIKHGDEIVEGVFAISEITGKEMIHVSNQRLYKKQNNKYIHDNFLHEVNLLIEESGKLVLLCGCAHRGIINIVKSALNFAKEKVNNKYIFKVLGGFHLMDVNVSKAYDQIFLNYLGEELEHLNVEQYITCHCTGSDSYNFLKKRLKNRLVEIHTGDYVTI